MISSRVEQNRAIFDRQVSTNERNGDVEVGRSDNPVSGFAAELNPYSEDALALELEAAWENEWIYISETNSWYHFDGKRWKRDRINQVKNECRGFLRAKAENLARFALETPSFTKDLSDQWIKSQKQLAARLGSKKTSEAVLGLVSAGSATAQEQEIFDTHPELLSTPSGVVELTTGRLRPAKHDDYLRHLTSVEVAQSEEPPSQFIAFLEQTFDGDAEMVAYLKRVAGSLLIGRPVDSALFFFWGQGANGKSVLMNVWQSILGDYGKPASCDTFLDSRFDRHPAELATLQGARAVLISEVPNGRKWNEALIKSFTGGDPITARMMRENPTSFKPQANLVFAGNTRPSFSMVGESMKRRFHVVEFTNIVPKEKRDPRLEAKLVMEAPMILKWMIEGAEEVLKVGLQPPTSVLKAAEDYLASEDHIEQWIEDRCKIDEKVRTQTSILYDDYIVHAKETRAPEYSKKAFGSMLHERGYRRTRNSSARFNQGLELKRN